MYAMIAHMVAFRAQVVFPMKTAISRDYVTNAWSFYLAGDLAAGRTTVKGALKVLYDSFASYRSMDLDPTKAHVVWYNLDEPKPRAPVEDSLLNLNVLQATNTLPHELAICLSFQANKLSGLVQARRRGRIYLGPWGNSANDPSTGRPANALQTALTTGINDFKTALGGIPDVKWAVYSPTQAAIEQGDMAFVGNGWVDDEWDIQRRRGIVASKRNTFVVT